MITFDDVRAAVNLTGFDPAPAHKLMMPNPRGLGREMPTKSERSRQAGVLILIYPADGDLQIVLTRRTETLRGHSGQISFPGGRRDPQDASFIETALRETCEELGICDGLDVVGTLSPIYIPPSDFEVFPTVAIIPTPPYFQPSPDEVAEVFSFPLTSLLAESTKRLEEWDLPGGIKALIPFYAVQGHNVWGATAIMLSELEQRLRLVLNQPAVEVTDDSLNNR